MPRFALAPIAFLLTMLPANAADGVPSVLQAEEISGQGKQKLEARGRVELEQGRQRLYADWLTLFPEQDRLQAGEQTRLCRDQDELRGGHLELDNKTRTGQLDAPSFRLGNNKQQGRGDALKLIFDGPDRYTLERARFTSCKVGEDDWFIRARELQLDYSRNIAEARGGTVEFKGVTLPLYLPYLDFTLDGSRKSGFLAPSLGTSSGGGFQLTVPYYWNIAPNYDATFSPTLIAKRGMLLGNEFRYLGQHWQGQVDADVIPHDKQFGGSRHAVNWQHRQALGNGWRSEINFQQASDDRYFADFGDRIAVASKTYLPRDLLLQYQGERWSATLRSQRYQTLQDPANRIEEPYARLPQLTINAQPAVPAPLRADLNLEVASFRHGLDLKGIAKPNGERLLFQPQISLPLSNAYGFLTPKLGLHATKYRLEQGGRASRYLPTFSLDSGLFFDRELSWKGRNMVQSLEPRLYYVRIPYRDQSKLPNFDSSQTDFNFAQMFVENRFTGNDRINDANQLTAVVSSRFYDADSGAERLRLVLGQRFYFDAPRVGLAGNLGDTQETASDLIASASGQPYEHWWLDAGWQYDNRRNKTQKTSLNLRYQPATGKLLNLRYRLDQTNGKELIKQLDLSSQWPLAAGWSGVARHNWSINDRRTLEALAGLEYNSGCWAFRLVGQRFATGANKARTTFFVQLELNDVGRLGSNPLQTLKDSIPGYTKLNQPTR